MLELSTVYARQEEYEVLSRAMLEAAYESLTREGFEAMIRQYPNYVMVQRDFAGREEVLLHCYRRSLDGGP